MGNLIFYTVAGTVIGLMAGAFGAGLAVTLTAALVGPPAMLLAYQIYRASR